MMSGGSNFTSSSCIDLGETDRQTDRQNQNNTRLYGYLKNGREIENQQHIGTRE